MYKRKLFIYFFIVFTAFAVAITILQYNRETEYKISKLNSILDSYSELVANYVLRYNLTEANDFSGLDSIHLLIGQENLRISIIDLSGKILYDSNFDDYDELDNHISRPEIEASLFSKYGTDIRKSASTGVPHYYYAKKYDLFFVRAAIDYDLNIREFLRADRVYLIIIFAMFLFITLIMIYISQKFGNTLSKLKDFAIKAGKNESIDNSFVFPDNELGIISKQIINIYENLTRTKDAIMMEKEKLIRHLYISNEGIAIFSPQKSKILSNSLFTQNINFIADKPGLNPELVFNLPDFKDANDFIDYNLAKEEAFLQTELPAKSFIINKRGRYFSFHIIIFSDKTFEISVNDITSQEKEKGIKQQLTSNIAHELRTPVSSIKGYLETIINVNDLNHDKQTYFIDKAYRQAIRLSELITDMSVLNKIEEGAVPVDNSDIRVNEIVKEVVGNLEMKLTERGIKTDVMLEDHISISGSYSLIWSIFQNLFENTIIHAGENILIKLRCYFEDENYYYFSYYDTGTGIPEKHVNRIFERFYRVDKGRSRKSGGTGLGLAIIKNAVIFHQGDISVKNREEGGLEFFFTIRKKPGLNPREYMNHDS